MAGVLGVEPRAGVAGLLGADVDVAGPVFALLAELGARVAAMHGGVAGVADPRAEEQGAGDGRRACEAGQG